MSQRQCSCFVIPHADDCELFIGMTQSGERILERRSGLDRRASVLSEIAQPLISGDVIKGAVSATRFNPRDLLIEVLQNARLVDLMAANNLDTRIEEYLKESNGGGK